jgi:precorrin-6A synthase
MTMRKVLIIGIGAGNPDYVTVQAINALNQADVIFVPDKGEEKEDLRQLRLEICERYIEHKAYRLVGYVAPERSKDPPDYKANVRDWHARIEQQYEALLTHELGEGECGAFLVWGDPTLYDSTLRIIEALRASGVCPFDYEIIPGITSVQALAARHRIPLNRIGESVHITTGRKLAQGFPADADSVIVMLDGEQAFKKIDGADIDIYWGAYLGTVDERLVSGRLADVARDIESVRANARAEKGWIMDTYLLRKSEAE